MENVRDPAADGSIRPFSVQRMEYTDTGRAWNRPFLHTTGYPLQYTPSHMLLSALPYSRHLPLPQPRPRLYHSNRSCSSPSVGLVHMYFCLSDA